MHEAVHWTTPTDLAKSKTLDVQFHVTERHRPQILCVYVCVCVCVVDNRFCLVNIHNRKLCHTVWCLHVSERTRLPMRLASQVCSSCTYGIDYVTARDKPSGFLPSSVVRTRQAALYGAQFKPTKYFCCINTDTTITQACKWNIDNKLHTANF